MQIRHAAAAVFAREVPARTSRRYGNRTRSACGHRLDSVGCRIKAQASLRMEPGQTATLHQPR